MARATSIIREDVALIVQELGERLAALAGGTLLVTGSNGFVCSYLVDVVAKLNDSGLDPRCRVLALDNFVTGKADRLSHLAGRDDIVFVDQDLRLPYAPPQSVDWLVHGAGIASPPVYRRLPLETIDVNTGGTRSMLELARAAGFRSMLYLSTSEVYGDPDPAFIPTPEDYRGSVACRGPRACYDESKRLAETLCYEYQRLFGAPVKTVRIFNGYGPGQRIDDGRIVPDLLGAALRHEDLVLYSDGRATRSFCYVRDLVRALLYVFLSDADGEVFNVGNGDEEVSIAHVAETVREVAGEPRLSVRYQASGDAHYLTDNPRRRCPSLAKLEERFPYRPQVMLREGLSRTLASYREDTADSAAA